MIQSMICFVLCFFVVHPGCVMTDTHRVLLCTRTHGFYKIRLVVFATLKVMQC